MSQADVERWTPDARALKPEDVKPSDQPIREKTFEADGAAGFLRKFWKPQKDGAVPGMETTESVVPLAVADEIESLVRAIRTVHNDGLFPTLQATEVPALEARGRWLSARLSNACELVLDDDVVEPADGALAAAKARAEDDTRATRIETLLSLAAVADEIKDRLATIKDFETAWIAEAREVAQKLSADGPAQPGRAADPTIDFRNRLLVLLDRRVSRVRRAARYVYVDHPETVRLVTSAYERKKRLEAKRRKQKGEEKSQ